jgi:hypothetical protein
MAKIKEKVNSRDAVRHKRKKTSIGHSHNSKNNTYRGQGK